MIIKLNCSIYDFNKLYKKENDFDSDLQKVFESIDSNDNLDVNENNYLSYNDPNFFYVPINTLETILNDIKRSNDKMNLEIITDLIDYCNYLTGLQKLIGNFEKTLI